MSRVEDQTADIGNNIAGQVRDKAAQVKDKAEQVSQHLRDVGNQVSDTAHEKIGEVRDKAADYYNRSRDAAQEWEQSLESYVQEKPLQSVLIAAGVGLILGLIWRRR
jgi:ElaB/YqjD/DUF883 family membrane-anchored ribosome-binding protein